MKKKEILPTVTLWMDLEGIMLSELSDRERQILYDLTRMWNLKKSQTHRKRDQICGCQRCDTGGRGNWKKMSKRYKLPAIR